MTGGEATVAAGDDDLAADGELGLTLRALRIAAGRSQEQQAAALTRLREASEAPIDRGQVARWERGARTPRLATLRLVARLHGIDARDLQSLASSGLGADEVRRRDLMALATAGPGASVEAVRARVGTLLPARATGSLVEEWDDRAASYGMSAQRVSAQQLLEDVVVDVAEVREVLGRRDITPAQRDALLQVLTRLSGVAAVALLSEGRRPAAARWWVTAERAAGPAVANVNAFRAINALYGGSADPAEAITRARAALQAVADPSSVVLARAHGAQAQAYARLRMRKEAFRALDDMHRCAERVPAAARGPAASTHTYPDRGPLHTASYVYTWLGDTSRAADVQEVALLAGAPWDATNQAQIGVHRALCTATDGDVQAGLESIRSVIDALSPHARRNRYILDVAEGGLALIRPHGPHRRALRELADHIARLGGAP